MRILPSSATLLRLLLAVSKLASPPRLAEDPVAPMPQGRVDINRLIHSPKPRPPFVEDRYLDPFNFPLGIDDSSPPPPDLPEDIPPFQPTPAGERPPSGDTIIPDIEDWDRSQFRTIPAIDRPPPPALPETIKEGPMPQEQKSPPAKFGGDPANLALSIKPVNYKHLTADFHAFVNKRRDQS